MKYFGLAAVALMMTIGASAGTLTEVCNSVVSSNGGTSASGALTCPQITSAQLGGATLNSVAILEEDTFNGGNPGTAQGFNFSYSGITPDLTLTPGSAPNTCLGPTTAGSSATCLNQISGITIGGGAYNFANTITSDLGAYQGSSTFTFASVSIAINPADSQTTLLSSGQVGATPFVTFTYTVTSGTPEPGSMMLLGSGLLAAGLIGRKKLAGRK
jgi:PEP-CTERM motif-containing protein